MEKRPGNEHGLFENDELDEAIANVDDTGMVKSQQQIVEEEQLEELPPQQPEEESP